MGLKQQNKTKKKTSTSKDTWIKITKFGNYGGFLKVIL